MKPLLPETSCERGIALLVAADVAAAAAADDDDDDDVEGGKCWTGADSSLIMHWWLGVADVCAGFVVRQLMIS
eukprot:125878-Pelagomonas_calceolata.AAC.1